MAKKGDSVPYIDFYEGFLGIGREKDLPEDFITIEGEKYLVLFFPKSCPQSINLSVI